MLTLRDFARLIAPTHRRIMHIVSRAKLTMVSDAEGLQRLQVSVLNGETRDNVERFQQYGFSSHPQAGAEVLMLSLGGSRDHPVIIAVDDRRTRPGGAAAGETEVYNDAGVSLRLLADGTLLIKGPLKVRMETPMLEVTGDIKDNCDGGGRTMQEMRDTYNRHQHPGTGLPTEKM
ncbi:phage baseplate assembly protein V [Mesorhizobium sp. KR1-2]|uniref:phage baseplate assembly protein V n=1 Tax=Mesorhizobium sp. KR1-2 TaxID=3156609 RepID=UPI0032B3FA3F